MNYLPTGCPISIPDPAARKAAMERARLRLYDNILAALDEIQTYEYEIDLCDQELNEVRELAAIAAAEKVRCK
jgi:hypothetical protein